MVKSHQHVCNNMEESFRIPATFLPLINCRRQTIEQIIFPGQGNTAWINSITWYSLSTQCGQFSRRSAPFFFIPETIWWPPSGALSMTSGDKQNHRARKCLCWHCVEVWAPQGEPIPAAGRVLLCKPDSHRFSFFSYMLGQFLAVSR